MKNVGKYLVCVACGALVFCIGGCGESSPPVQQKPASFSDYSAPATTTETPVTPTAPPPPSTEQVKAEAGVGEKGQGYGGGIITEPIHQYFHIQDRLVFEVQLPHAIELYKANNNGKGPKTHEAYMKEIIQDNAIVLPTLPDGHKYLYDPKTEMLMVERPAGPNQTGS